MAEQDCARTERDRESDLCHETATSKRPRGSPTLYTPHRQEKRVALRELVNHEVNHEEGVQEDPQPMFNLAPRRLINLNENITTSHSKEKWSEEEVKALAEFVLFHTPGDKWPSHKQSAFWTSASEFVEQRVESTVVRRSAEACRWRVTGHLAKRFKTPKDAEAWYNGQAVNVTANAPSLSTVCHGLNTTATQTSPVESCLVEYALNQLPAESRLLALSKLFSAYLSDQLSLIVPNDFLNNAASAMLRLSDGGRTNVLYNLAKGIGTMRPDQSDSRLPIKRMPLGLVEYIAQFFAADNLQQVSCPTDYRQWLQTMYAHFGQKWIKLHRGPMWCTVMSTQEASTSASRTQKTMEALVNVPAVAERSLRYDFASSEITLDAQIQLNVLDEAAKSNPGAWWWLKADGCDINKGLKETTKLQWSGDVDLGDGALQKLYQSYKLHLQKVNELSASAADGLRAVLSSVSEDLEFIQTELVKSNNEYTEKLQLCKQNEKEMMSLAWKVKELNELNEIGRNLFRTINVLITEICKQDALPEENIPRQLAVSKQKLVNFIKGVTRHQRTAATHILVFMISTEDRRKKPYALPIQCLPYKGIGDGMVRELANRIICEMVKRKMHVAGFTTDGEWNSLRAKGYSRPLSIFQIRAEARSKFSRMGLKRMLAMITPQWKNGTLTAMLPYEAVSPVLIAEIQKWYSNGAEEDDVIERLRLRTVPPGYKIHNWIEGKDETKAEKLRSILAQLEYTHSVNLLHSKGVLFKDHLYVPEVHPITGEEFCEREDEGHIFKRIGTSLRQGGPCNLQLERFEEALYDTTAGLTYCALSGVRKQSVEDVERLFGLPLIEWMEKKGYSNEAMYLRVVRNWRRACDERGLTDDQRSTFNQEFLDYILDDLMPWHKDGQCDFSRLEVNRNITTIRGFTRETLIALAANIESREWRRQFNTRNRIPAENPRASSTDDVECFFSMLRDTVGKDFTLKEVYYGWRKVTEEFVKRMDPDLPFYYHTSSKCRYYEGLIPDFSHKLANKKTKRLPRFEMLGDNSSRVTMSLRGNTSIRTKFHSAPLSLPPPPGTSNAVLYEHSYACNK